MKNTKSSVQPLHDTFGAATVAGKKALLCGVALLLTACGTVIEESSYDGLALGDSKATVLSKLAELPNVSSVRPALARAAGGPKARSPAPYADLVLLASAAVGADQTAAEREYLLHYDLWYWEEDDRQRTVVLTFSSDSLGAIHGRRRSRWLQRFF